MLQQLWLVEAQRQQEGPQVGTAPQRLVRCCWCHLRSVRSQPHLLACL